MIPSWAKVGAKVVCVKDAMNRYGPGRIPALKAGPKVYTVREVTKGYYTGEPCFLLDETPPFQQHHIARFRPVHTLRSDIRMVKALVREMPASERLDRLLELLNS